MKKLGEEFKLGFISPFMLRVGEGDGDGGGDGDGAGDGGGNNANFQDTPEFKAAVQQRVEAAVAEATDGLSRKNQELLDDLKKTKSAMKGFEGLDPESVRSMMEQINQSEEMKLIAEGKFDEVIQKRTDSITAKHQEELSALQKQLEETTGAAQKYKTILERNTISDAVRNAALKANVLPDALDDIIRRGQDVFSVNEEGEIEARDQNGNLISQDNLLLTPERFVESLKKTAKHYWGNSQGSGAEGNDGSNRDNMDGSSLADTIGEGGKLDLETYRKKRKAMSGDRYNKRR